MKCIKNVKVNYRSRLPPETDYATYRFSRQELFMYFLSGGVFMAVVSWLLGAADAIGGILFERQGQVSVY